VVLRRCGSRARLELKPGGVLEVLLGAAAVRASRSGGRRAEVASRSEGLRAKQAG
jgi:hypothetical protein